MATPGYAVEIVDEGRHPVPAGTIEDPVTLEEIVAALKARGFWRAEVSMDLAQARGGDSALPGT